jgi:hypothetical protein
MNEDGTRDDRRSSMTVEAEADPDRYLVWVTVPLTFEFVKWANEREANAIGAKVLAVARNAINAAKAMEADR